MIAYRGAQLTCSTLDSTAKTQDIAGVEPVGLMRGESVVIYPGSVCGVAIYQKGHGL